MIYLPEIREKQIYGLVLEVLQYCKSVLTGVASLLFAFLARYEGDMDLCKNRDVFISPIVAVTQYTRCNTILVCHEANRRASRKNGSGRF
jgi:hypothetical protein